MLVATLAVALGSITIGLIFAGPTGFFGASHTFQERLEGNILLVVGAVMILFSFSLFRRKNIIPFLVILGSLLAGVASLGIHVSQDVIIVVRPFTAGMIICYLIDFLIGKKIKEKGGEENELKIRKFNKILIGIPLVLLAMGWLYINFGQYWQQEAKIAHSDRESITKLPYELYEPESLPAGYILKETRMGGTHGKYFFYAEYRNSQQDYFMLAQFSKPKNLSLDPPKCSIYGSSSDSFEIVDNSGSSSGVNSDCEAITTPKGRKVYLMEYEIANKGNYAVSLMGNTLLSVTGYTFPQAELVRLFDSLEVKEPSQVIIKVPDQKTP
jgi:hypothetical protein